MANGTVNKIALSVYSVIHIFIINAWFVVNSIVSLVIFIYANILS